ncbi:hypothetical protein HK097_003542 [Rhizophlyctis rosea]|uniref:Non-specific serine/threonine protein kinase n=1 Tax=Rhizophlyctis rosea TaxID=64517 RepID=A0AAD5X0J5_9FUNG|nr:hypothetical protein HK097_003542 [Rhizophlyctis rosea]
MPVDTAIANGRNGSRDAYGSAGRSSRRHTNMFGPYKLQRTIGEGEFGKVKLAVHYDTGKEVAIKLIKKENIESPNRRAKLMREISILQTLDHPFIVKLIEVIETEQYIGMVLEYASGGELFEHILAHRYLKERDACRFFAQLIAGVNYLHALNIVHRDLKLENLLLDGQRNIIITDFGFANRSSHDKDALLLTSCGSPCYAAPELVISDGYVGEAADIWSCGVILYAMLCGYLPFDDDPQNPDGDNINLLYKYILETELDFPEYISDEARDLLRKMLVPDPKYRAQMRDVMNHRWLAPYAYFFREETDTESQRDSPRPMEGIETHDTSSTLDLDRSDALSQRSYSTPPASPARSVVSRTATPVPGAVASSTLPTSYAFDIPSPTPGVQAVMERDDLMEDEGEERNGADSGVVRVPAVPVAPAAVTKEVQDEGEEGTVNGGVVDEDSRMMDIDVTEPAVEETAVQKQETVPVVDVKIDTSVAPVEQTHASVLASVVSSPTTTTEEPATQPPPSEAIHNSTPQRNSPEPDHGQENKENGSVLHKGVSVVIDNEAPRGRARAGSATSYQRAPAKERYARGKSVDRPETRSVVFSSDARKEGKRSPTEYGRKSLDIRRTVSKGERKEGILSWFRKDTHEEIKPPTHRPNSIQESETSTNSVPHSQISAEPTPRPSMAPTVMTTRSDYTITNTYQNRSSKLRYHSGPIDQRALSNKHPAALISEVAKYLSDCGMEIRGTGEEFKVKVHCRFGQGGIGSSVNKSSASVVSVSEGGHHSEKEEFDESKLHHHLGADTSVSGNSTVTLRASVDSNLSRSGSSAHAKAERERKRRGAAKLASIIASLPVSLVKRLRYFREYGYGWNKGFSGKGDLEGGYGVGWEQSQQPNQPQQGIYVSDDTSLRGSVSNLYLPRTSLALSERYPTPAASPHHSGNASPTHGHPHSQSHPGLMLPAPYEFAEEIRFTVEVQKIKNLPGLYVVEFKRLKGDIWVFKRVYQDVVSGLRGVAFRGVGEI